MNSRLIAWSLCLVAGCYSARTPPAPTPLASPSLPASTAAEPPLAEGEDACAATEELLRRQLKELARPPFGTGASATIIVGGTTQTWVDGSRWTGGPAVALDTRFNVASVSKLLTAAHIVTLAQEGRLTLDDTLKSHLPGVSVNDAAGDHAGEITIAQLLTHRAGLRHHAKTIEPEKAGTSWSSPSFYQKMTQSWALELQAKPGNYSYSNLGYGLLGAIIERVGQCSYADCMTGFLPKVGMLNATFDVRNGTRNFAHGRVLKEGAEAFNSPDWYMSRYALPFNGLWTSTADLARFGVRLNQSALNQSAPTLPESKAGPLSAMVAPLDTETGHGVGAVQRQRFGVRSFEHDGSGPGFLAWLVAVPAKDLVVAVATNGGGEQKPQASRFRQIVESILEAGAKIGRCSD